MLSQRRNWRECQRKRNVGQLLIRCAEWLTPVADAVARFENEGRDSDAISGRVSAHEILRTSERAEGAERKAAYCPNQQMGRMWQSERTCRLFYERIWPAELPEPSRQVSQPC